MNTNLQKYLKYKSKYLDLKNELQLQVGGSNSFLYGGAIIDDLDKIKEISNILNNGIVAEGVNTQLTTINHLNLIITDPGGSSIYNEEEFVDLIRKAVHAYHSLKLLNNTSDIDTLMGEIKNDRDVIKPQHEQMVRDLQIELSSQIATNTTITEAFSAAQVQLAATQTQLAAAQGQIANLQAQLVAAPEQLAVAQAKLAGANAGGPPHVVPAALANAALANAAVTEDSIIANISSFTAFDDAIIEQLFPLNNSINISKVYQRVGAIMIKVKKQITSSTQVERDAFIQRLIEHINKVYSNRIDKQVTMGKVTTAVKLQFQ